MNYLSTRGDKTPRRFCEILLEGLAPDGGLYLPEAYPQVDAATLSKWRGIYAAQGYADLAFEVLSLYIDDIPAEDLRAICRKTYTQEVFGTQEIVPLKQLEAGLYLEALSNGPTLAFKDIAMQLLGNLFEYELARRGEDLNILGATSGDTGGAAEYAMRGKKGVRVFMTSPAGRMSPFQQAQMFSLMDANIFNIAVDGVFDDCQDMVKAVSNDLEFKRKYKIGTVNSINWARLMAQVVYYFAGYFQATQESWVRPHPNPFPEGEGMETAETLGSLPLPGGEEMKTAVTPGLLPVQDGEKMKTAMKPGLLPLPPGEGGGEGRVPAKVSFSVPSGNFGNVCAGHVARMMGLPIEQLVVATNENDVLDEFFRTGIYRVRGSSDTHETSSPSMDISKASNFERFVFDLLGRDGAKTADFFGRQLSQNGMFDLSADPAFKQTAAKYGFISGKSTHANRLATIKDVFARHGVIIDTHTADGVKVAREHTRSGVPMIVLETALPIKFAATIVEALGREPDRPARFEGIEALPKRVMPMRADVTAIKTYIGLNCQ